MGLFVAARPPAFLAIILLFVLVLLIFPAPSRGIIPAIIGNSTDHSALLSFKSLITSDPYKALDGWNDSVSFCHWRGVTCGSLRQSDRVVALNLSSLELRGAISPHLGNLTFLEELTLTSNNFDGSFPQEVGRLPRLRFLDLSLNSLAGELTNVFGRCEELVVIRLENNKIQGRIPVNISRCSNLEELDLRKNKLNGRIPEEVGFATETALLDLSHNNLSGSIPSSLGNMSSLRVIDLSNNNLEGGIPSELGGLKELRALGLLINRFSGKIPPPLYNLSSLRAFGVGGNRLSGELPVDIGTKLPNLVFFDVHENLFGGPIPASMINSSGLKQVYLSNNSFTGPIPSNLGLLPNLSELHLGGNNLVSNGSGGWRFITSLTNCSYLKQLDLSDNQLEGIIPDSIGNLSLSLTWLRMRANKISGRIPSGIGKFNNLTMLAMEKNHLSGSIPESLGELTNLEVLALDENWLSGEIPDSVGNISNLNTLFLYTNNLTGSIPARMENLKKLTALDISYNKLSGSVPKGLLGSLSLLADILNISHNSLTGSIPEEIGSLVNLRALVLSDNKFSGEIPMSLGKCQVLEYVQLENNFLEGRIPRSLENLKGIQVLNLSHNGLSGLIPEFLETLPLLQNLDLSYNDFEGQVPKEGVFNDSSSVSVAGNQKVCGGIPELNLQPCQQATRKKRAKLLAYVLIICVLAIFSLVILFLFAKKYQFLKRPKTFAGFPSAKRLYLSVSYDDLRKATEGFSSANLIGRGGFGSVYKGVLKDQEKELVAVKVLDCQQHGASKSFLAECDVLRNIRHRNLVRILTTCSTVDHNGNEFKALIYEFMPNGSLESWLHPGEEESNFRQLRKLTLRQRVDIATDVASALSYLHGQGQVPVVHCDLKPSNILLDGDMTAHVGDFGLARFLIRRKVDVSFSGSCTSSSLGLKGSVGYIAPEYGMGGEVSTCGDMYSFGVLLLELLTGKRPTDDIFTDSLSLRKYVEGHYPDQVTRIIDPYPSLTDDDDGNDRTRGILNDCVVTMIGIGLACSVESPTQRMGIDSALRLIEGVNGMLHDY